MPSLPSAIVVAERLCFQRYLSVHGVRCTPPGRYPLDNHPPPLGRHPPPLGRHPLPWADTPPGRHPLSPEDGHCSGQYASYWNAFLLPPANEVCIRGCRPTEVVCIQGWFGRPPPPRNSKSGRYASYWNAFLFQIIMVDCISSHYVLYSSEGNIPNKNLSESRGNFIRLAIIFDDLFGLRFSYFKNLSVSTAVLSLEIIVLILSKFSRARLGHFGNFHSPKI